MGRKSSIALIGVGVFLIVTGLLSAFYAYPRLAVVPLNQDTVSKSVGDGATVFDIASGREIQLDLLSTRNVNGDVAASEAASAELGRDIAVWETVVYTDEPGAAIDADNPPRSGSHDRVAFDRHTGEAVDCCGSFVTTGVDPETGEEIHDQDTAITGQYFKLPFRTEQRTYQFWDGALKDSTDLVFEDTEDIDGLETYRFRQVIEATDVGNIDAPASLFGIDAEGEVTLDRIYSNTRTLWIEPETGVIIRGEEDQLVTADYQGEQVATLTDVVIGYDEETVADNVDTYSTLSTLLQLVRLWLPVGGVVLGLLLVLAGALVLRRSRAGGRHTAAADDDRELSLLG